MWRCCLVLVLFSCARPHVPGPTVVVLCVEALRHDYPERVELPAFAALAREGAHAERLLSVFPSNSLPNQAAIATGLLPAKHGVIDNWFYDREWKWGFDGDPDDVAGVMRAEPLWVAAERRGIATGVIGWSGVADAPDPRPSRISQLDREAADADRVAELEGWLHETGPAAPRLLFVYLDDLDDVAHQFGPDADETLAAVKRYDGYVGRIADALHRDRGPSGATLIVLGDHGMTSVARVVYLRAELAKLGISAEPFAGGGSANLYTASDPRAVRERLAADSALYRAWLPSEAAERWGYDDPRRVGDLVLVAESGVYLSDSVMRGTPIRPARSRGMHGWPPDNPDMAGTLFLSGRGVPAGRRWPEASVLDIYPTVCKLLGLDPPPGVDGHILSGIGEAP